MDAYSSLLTTAFRETACDASSHPFVISTTSHDPKGQKESVTEIMFEEHNAPAIFLASTAALAAFSVGKTNAIVVDSGFSGVSVDCVSDGIVLERAARSCSRGEGAINERVKNLLTKKHPGISASHHLTSAHANASDAYKAFCANQTQSDFLSSHIPMLQFAKLDLREVTQLIPAESSYELPDGTVVRVNENPEVFRAGEVVYEEKRDDASAPKGGDEAMIIDGEDESRRMDVALHKVVKSSLTSVESDLRPALLSSIVSCGGLSRLTGFDSRLEKEVRDITPSSLRVKVNSGKGQARINASWIGGSILGSLGSFQQMWLSKTEYDEYGVTLGVQRFP
jgi:actin-related protein